MNMILNGKYNLNTHKWKNVSKSAKDLVTSMLTVDPGERIKIDDIIKHSWINYVSEQYILLFLIIAYVCRK